MSYDAAARAVGKAFSLQVAAAPSAYTHMLTAVDFLLGPTAEIVIAGRRGAPDVAAMARAIDRAYTPDKVVVFRPDDGGERIAALAPYVREQHSLDGRATAYVCRDFACQQPTTDTDAVAKLVSGR
jgi:uncharacterized protein